MAFGNYGRILLVDSDESMRSDLDRWLPPRGFDLTCVTTAEATFRLIDSANFDLVILAMVLSDRDGLDVCRELSRRFPTPVLMVSETSMAYDEVSGLEAGADDFLAKPLRPEIILARVRSLLRRSHRSTQQDVLRTGDLSIDRPRIKATLNGKDLPLTPIEFKILCNLALASGAAVSRDELLLAVWNTTYVPDSRLVDTHVRNLRRKLRDAGSTLSVYGVRGIGYRLASDSPPAGARPSPWGNGRDSVHHRFPYQATLSLVPGRMNQHESL